MKSVSGANLAKPEQEPSGEAGSWRAEGWWAWSCDGRCFCIGIQKTWCLNLEHVFWLRHTCTHNIRRTRSGWRSSTNHRCYWLRVITCARLVNGRQQSCSSAVLRVSSRNINLFSGDLDVSRMNLLKKDTEYLWTRVLGVRWVGWCMLLLLHVPLCHSSFTRCRVLHENLPR